MKKKLNHRIFAPPSFHACGDGRQVAVTEHFLSLPVYRARPDSPRLDVYFSIVECVRDDDQQWWQSLVSKTPQERAEMYVDHAGMKTAKDMILYLQGGPGFGAPTPIVGLGMTKEASWAGKALSQYKRVVLMDQRGTGRSTPITKQTLEKRFPDLFLLDSLDDTHSKSIEDFDDSKRAHEALSEATEYMAQFRADNIVQDAEAIKDTLMLSVDTEVRMLSCTPQGLFCFSLQLLISSP
jgi:pimeloyl-ACP methyl ester carboxylesterase